MQDIIVVNGVKHVILEQRGSIFNPKFVGRSVEDGTTHNIKLTRIGLFKHNLELVNQVLFTMCFGVLFLIFLAMFG